MTAAPHADTPVGGNYYREMPNDPAAEQAVIGGMLLSKDAIADVVDMLARNGEDFYTGRHAIIYRAILSLFDRSIPADAITVANALSAEDLSIVGGAPYLHECMAAIPSPASTRWYAQIVKERALAYTAVQLGTKITQLGYSTSDGQAALDEISQLVFDATMSKVDQGRTASLADLLQPVIDEIEAASEQPSAIPTGFSDLDRLLAGGLRPGQLIIPAARPGGGKSIFGLDVARHAAIKLGLPTLIFSLEMDKKEVILRLLAAEARVHLQNLRTGELSIDDWTKLARRMAEINDAPLFVDDMAAAGLSYIRAKARRFKQQHNLKLLIVDYLQLMAPVRMGANVSRQQEVGENSTGLKNLGRELELPVIAACQLNREVEKRNNKVPMLSDLRESGNLEQDADIVMMIHRDDLYDKESARAGEADFIVVKHRNGPLDTVTVAAQLHMSRFVDMAVM